MIGILNKPTPTSEQLKMMKILSALVLHLFLKSLCNNRPFDVTIANAVNIKYIWSTKVLAKWLWGFEGCHFREKAKFLDFVSFMFGKKYETPPYAWNMTSKIISNLIFVPWKIFMNYLALKGNSDNFIWRPWEIFFSCLAF